MGGPAHRAPSTTAMAVASRGIIHSSRVREICRGNSVPASCVGRATKEIHMLGLLIGAAVLGGGFVATRNFVRTRLRFVDAVRRPAAPVGAGVAAGLAASVVALPLGALLPGSGWAPARVG